MRHAQTVPVAQLLTRSHQQTSWSILIPGATPTDPVITSTELMEADMDPRLGFPVENATVVDQMLDRLAEDAPERFALEGSGAEYLGAQPEEMYFISYRHPIILRKKWLRMASRAETQQYLDQTMFPERMEGLDLCVAPRDLRFILITNHDGDVFLAHASARPTITTE